MSQYLKHQPHNITGLHFAIFHTIPLFCFPLTTLMHVLRIVIINLLIILQDKQTY